MDIKTISVTEAARNFSDCVNRAHYQNVTYVLLKNGEAVAQLGPTTNKKCTGRELAELLRNSNLAEEDAQAWAKDRKAAHKILKVPSSKW